MRANPLSKVTAQPAVLPGLNLGLTISVTALVNTAAVAHPAMNNYS